MRKRTNYNTGIERRFIKPYEGQERYCLGKNQMMQLARDAGAIVKFGRSVNLDVEKIDRYLDSIESVKTE